LEIMADFVKVGTLLDLQPGQARAVEVRGNSLALCNVDGQIYATSNTCAHRGGPLGEGSLEGQIITCPWHAFQFDVTTGRCTHNPALGVACFQVRIEGQDILVEC
jgi:nitrite reductase/ring-hydroxylating ferredoxin subunit